MKRFVLKREEISKEDFQIDYESLLNEQQLSAVLHGNGPALVIAGAGTGKTRTLVYRVARLIESGADPTKILLLTFTRRAAREMLDRASAILDERCKRVKGGTFHYYCSQLLRRFHAHTGYPDNFTILDTADAQEILQMLRTEFNYHKLAKRFPSKGALQQIFSTSINKRKSIHEVIAEGYEQFFIHLEQIEHLEKEYQIYKRTNYLMDFDDLLIQTVKLMSDDDVRAQVQALYQHVLIDEYQDTNAIQAELVQLFTPPTGNVMAVGDDAQSIYAFRGANHKNIMRFPELFPGTKLIKLEENFRSTGNILRVANQMLEQAKEKYEKKLFSKREDGELPALVKTTDNREQSRFISQMILNLREQEIPLNEIAVLFRNGRDSFDLEIELGKAKIPYVKYGGQKFAEAAHIKDVLAHLRVVVNPTDTISWNRILMLIDGVGPKTASDFMKWLRSAGNPYELGASGIVSDSFKAGMYALSQLLIDLKQNDFSPSEAITHINRYYKSICEKKFDDHPKRLKDLESFESIALGYRDYLHLLEELVLDPIEATAVDVLPGKEDEQPMVLSTIHSAKGLEWKHVFIIQCLDGIIPSGYAIGDEEQLDEELRLLYVATTRAQDMLYFSYPVIQHGSYGDVFSKPSRFIEPFNEKILEPWVLIEEDYPNQPQLTDKIG